MYKLKLGLQFTDERINSVNIASLGFYDILPVLQLFSKWFICFTNQHVTVTDEINLLYITTIVKVTNLAISLLFLSASSFSDFTSLSTLSITFICNEQYWSKCNSYLS